MLDVGRCPRDSESEVADFVDYAIELEFPSTPAAVEKAMAGVGRLISDNVELDRIITKWTCEVLCERSEGSMNLDHIKTMEELQMAIAPGYQRWLDEKTRERARKSRQEGRQEGIQDNLLGMLEFRFGQLPPELIARIRAAEAEQLQAWSRQLLLADRIEDVFRVPS